MNDIKTILYLVFLYCSKSVKDWQIVKMLFPKKVNGVIPQIQEGNIPTINISDLPNFGWGEEYDYNEMESAFNKIATSINHSAEAIEKHKFFHPHWLNLPKYWESPVNGSITLKTRDRIAKASEVYFGGVDPCHTDHIGLVVTKGRKVGLNNVNKQRFYDDVANIAKYFNTPIMLEVDDVHPLIMKELKAELGSIVEKFSMNRNFARNIVMHKMSKANSVTEKAKLKLILVQMDVFDTLDFLCADINRETETHFAAIESYLNIKPLIKTHQNERTGLH